MVARVTFSMRDARVESELCGACWGATSDVAKIH